MPALAFADNLGINGVNIDLGARETSVTWISVADEIQVISTPFEKLAKLLAALQALALLNSSSCAPANAVESASVLSRCCAINSSAKAPATGMDASRTKTIATNRTVI